MHISVGFHPSFSRHGIIQTSLASAHMAERKRSFALVFRVYMSVQEAEAEAWNDGVEPWRRKVLWACSLKSMLPFPSRSSLDFVLRFLAMA